MANSSAGASSGDQPDGDGAHRLDVGVLGEQMSDHLMELVGLWTQQMTALAEAGVDPTPLVHALARTLRATADQLDPEGVARAATGAPSDN